VDVLALLGLGLHDVRELVGQVLDVAQVAEERVRGRVDVDGALDEWHADALPGLREPNPR
jgi:hypothetical protein